MGYPPSKDGSKQVKYWNDVKDEWVGSNSNIISNPGFVYYKINVDNYMQIMETSDSPELFDETWLKVSLSGITHSIGYGCNISLYYLVYTGLVSNFSLLISALNKLGAPVVASGKLQLSIDGISGKSWLEAYFTSTIHFSQVFTEISEEEFYS